MGAITELVEQAEQGAVKQARLDSLREAAKARFESLPSIADSSAVLEGLVPSARQETNRQALRWLAAAGLISATAGGTIGLARALSERRRRKELVSKLEPYTDAAAREIRVPIPTKRADYTKEAALWPWLVGAAAATPPALRAVGGHVEDVGRGALEGAQDIGRHLFTPTGSPFDNPYFLTAAIATALAGGYGGYRGISALSERRRDREVNRKLEAARKEFEQALRAQFKGGTKKSSAEQFGAALDALSVAHASGELDEQYASLEKAALSPDVPEEGLFTRATRGTGSKALGGYIALLALLAATGAGAGYVFQRGREKPRMEFEATRDLLRRRGLVQPPAITAEFAS